MKRASLVRRTALSRKPKNAPRRRANPTSHKQRQTPKKRKKKTTLKKLKETLWELCKQITRKRYANKDGTWTCYTSGVRITEPKGAHTGHYIPSSICSTELRYDLDNLRIQSYMENIHHSGNTLQFRENLIRDHGIEYVENLWKRNQATKGLSYREDWYEEKILHYQTLLQQL